MSLRRRNLTTASTGHCYCHKTCFSLRSASFAPMYAMPVKQMLDGLRFAEQKEYMKNVFIIGAGANNEIKMPTGIELKKKITEYLYFQ